MESSNSGSIIHDDYDSNDSNNNYDKHLDLPNRKTTAASDDELLKAQTESSATHDKKEDMGSDTSAQSDESDEKEPAILLKHNKPTHYVSNRTNKVYGMKEDGTLDVSGWSKKEYNKEIGEDGVHYTQVGDEPRKAVDFTPMHLVLPADDEPSTIIMGVVITELMVLRFLLFVVLAYLLVGGCRNIVSSGASAIGDLVSPASEETGESSGGCDCAMHGYMN